MKNILFAVAALAAGISFAAQNDALVSFSTQGPDKYADGTTVLDGECYALVFTPKGSDGAVFAADGSVSGGEIVIAAPVAKGGRCPKVLFQIDAAKVKTQYKNGSWGVYLLDTRSWGKEGVARVAGRAAALNAADLVAGSTVKLGAGSMLSVGVTEGTAAKTATVVPDGVATPEITGIRVEGAYVFVTAKGTCPFLQYDLSTGATPDAVCETANSPRSGADSADEEVTFIVPATEGSAFFRVGRR